MSDNVIKDQAIRLTKMWQACDKIYFEYAKSVGLTDISLVILEFIFNYEGDCTQKIICDDTFYPKQTVNTIIKTFIDDDIVVLNEIKTDRRNKAIKLSEKGKNFTKKIITDLENAEISALENMNVKQREQLLQLVEVYKSSLVDNINNIIK
ncbi:MarR family winged helix-turn-helix transcriptional regulator [Mycoplasma sp. P36-A1]|uniref:MarR family winged helix-turn-helix transcriptional regulator n=1 Tax=Mycoplasma sp. P36-A1 TaxID=3252900 RepID=UPI003C30D289